MLIKIEGVWINPRHVANVNPYTPSIAELAADVKTRSLIILANSTVVYSTKEPDELAALLNSDPEQAKALAQAADILDRRLATYVYSSEAEGCDAMIKAHEDYERRKSAGENVQWRHLLALNGNAYVVERLD